MTRLRRDGTAPSIVDNRIPAVPYGVELVDGKPSGSHSGNPTASAAVALTLRQVAIQLQVRLPDARRRNGRPLGRAPRGLGLRWAGAAARRRHHDVRRARAHQSASTFCQSGRAAECRLR